MTAEDVVESKQEGETTSQEVVSDNVVEESVACEHAATEQAVTEQEGTAQENVDTESAQAEESVQAEVVEAQASEQAPAPQSVDGTPEGQQGPQLTQDQRVGLLEALLLASGDPLPITRIEELLGCSKADVLALAETLKETYAAESRGLEVVNVSSKLQLRTKAIFAEYVRNLIAVKPRKLSQAALETLAVIAYQQPVVKSEVDKIRGVDVAPTIKTLLERKLVKILGYQATVGQPALYGTTEDFLSIFGLTSLAELPSLRDLKALVKEPGEALESGSEDNEEGAEEEVAEEGDSSTSVETSETEVAAPVQ
jgi:segregation and condensation protein B